MIHPQREQSAPVRRRVAALLRDDFWFIGACILIAWLAGAVAGGAVIYALMEL